MIFDWGENPPQPIDFNTRPELSIFRDTVARVRDLVKSKICLERGGLENITPPIILCRGYSLNRELEIMTRDSTREKNEKRSLTTYEMTSGCIFYSEKNLLAVLTGDEKIKRLLAITTTHEHIHSFTTFSDSKKGVRLGFLPDFNMKEEHGLIPGGFYEYEMPVSPEETPTYREDPRQLRLTENTTDLAVHLLLHEIFPGLEKRYPYIYIDGSEGKGLIEKKPDLLLTSLRALYRGKEQLLNRAMTSGGNLLQTLASEKVLLLSITSPWPGKNGIFDYIN